MLAHTTVEFNYLKTLAKTVIIPARQNHFFQEIIFNNAPVRRIAIAMNTNSAFTVSCTENPFWHQQFDLTQIRSLIGGQLIVDFDAPDNCRLYVTTMKAMKIQDFIPSIPIDNFKDHYVLVFDLTSMQDATEDCHYQELVGDPLRLELNFTLSLEHVTEFIVFGERMSSVAVDKFGVVGKKTSEMDNISRQQIIKRIPLLQYRYRGSFPSDYNPTLDNDSFAIINTQLSNMQGEHWIMLANFRQKFYFADSLDCKKYSFLKQQKEQMMPEPLQSISAFAVSTRYLQLFMSSNFDKEEITGFQEVHVLSFISNYM